MHYSDFLFLFFLRYDKKFYCHPKYSMQSTCYIPGLHYSPVGIGLKRHARQSPTLQGNYFIHIIFCQKQHFSEQQGLPISNLRNSRRTRRHFCAIREAFALPHIKLNMHIVSSLNYAALNWLRLQLLSSYHY